MNLCQSDMKRDFDRYLGTLPFEEDDPVKN